MDPDFSESWVKLTEESPVPILTGENLYTRRGFMPFIVHQGCKIVQIDIPKSGGLLESKKIADLADIFNIPVSAHNAIGPLGAIASAHCAAAIRLALRWAPLLRRLMNFPGVFTRAIPR
jgi:L-alanine-DL-glutamate epimerase-like enolase superfamily enzyme